MSYPLSGRASRRAQRGYPPRALHLIDVENLTGTGAPELAQARDLHARYAVLIPIGDLDQVVIASSHLTLKKTGCWCADLELLNVIGREHVAERFSRIAIASGDGGFAQAAVRLTSAGCQVIVVSRRVGLSRRLALVAGGKVLYIDPPDTGTPTSAVRNKPPDSTPCQSEQQ